jgi:hypothetical protein
MSTYDPDWRADGYPRRRRYPSYAPNLYSGIIKSLRIIASFILLGAVIAAIATDWAQSKSVDFRVIGAVLGGILGIATVWKFRSSDRDQ